MINNGAHIPDDSEILKVIEYEDPGVKSDMENGEMNTGEKRLIQNISYAIRQGHTQWRGGPVRPERICLVGSGPSLNTTEDELRQLIWEGATLVTMNAGYHWCIERGLQPKTQIVLDARPSNARFVNPIVPKCNYVLASQCAPEMWQAIEGRDHVWIFHAVIKDSGPMAEVLDKFYLGQWIGIGGGTTVATRAISLLRTAGYVRFDLFGIDCCWLGDNHHAMEQPENARDKWVTVSVGVKDRPETMKEFRVTHWQLKQAEDLLVMMRVNGQHFYLIPHGNGMFSYLMGVLGEDTPIESLVVEEETTAENNLVTK